MIVIGDTSLNCNNTGKQLTSSFGVRKHASRLQWFPTAIHDCLYHHNDDTKRIGSHQSQLLKVRQQELRNVISGEIAICQLQVVSPRKKQSSIYYKSNHIVSKHYAQCLKEISYS